MAEGAAAERQPGPPRARLFVALDLPDDARERLVGWRAGLLRGRNDLRPVVPEALHLTLVFLGYRPEEEIPAIGAVVAGAAEGREAPLLRPGRVVAVPPRRRPRLFALDLEDDGGRAGALQEALSDALEAGGFHRPERRRFWPHVTLARVPRGVRADPLAGEPPPGEPFRAGEVTLYRSHLSPRGARYEALARTALG